MSDIRQSRLRIFRYSGAIIAFLIGSGFASGQEVKQFFTAYGPVYGTLGGLITLAILLYATIVVLNDGRKLKLEDTNSIFRYYCGNVVGRFFEWLMPLFLLGIYVIMLSGASSLLSEYFGLPPAFGRILMLVLSLGTVLLGLERLTNVIGNIGPVIIAFVIAVALGCIFAHPAGIAEAASDYQAYHMTKATAAWWLSGITYGTFCAFTLMPFLAGIGKTLKSEQECTKSGALGSGAFAGTAILLSCGMSAYLPQLFDKSVPTVLMADFLIPGVGVVFSVIMLAGIYTTAVPMLWSVCNKLVTDDKSRKFRIMAVAFAALSYFGGSLPFATLINIIYPYMGYFGIAVLACIVLKRLSLRRKSRIS